MDEENLDTAVLNDEAGAHLLLGDESENDAALHERIISEEEAWRGHILDVRSLKVELPNGRVAGRDVVRHPGAAAVVALTNTGKIALVRQYRAALDRVTVEIPAGKLNLGEDPERCAVRELAEETGFVPGKIRYLTTIATTPGFTDELIHIYFATQLTFAGAGPDDDEFVNVDLVPLSELIDAVLDGKVEDAKTVIGALACDAIAHRLAAESGQEHTTPVPDVEPAERGFPDDAPSISTDDEAAAGA